MSSCLTYVYVYGNLYGSTCYYLRMHNTCVTSCFLAQATHQLIATHLMMMLYLCCVHCLWDANRPWSGGVRQSNHDRNHDYHHVNHNHNHSYYERL